MRPYEDFDEALIITTLVLLNTNTLLLFGVLVYTVVCLFI